MELRGVLTRSEGKMLLRVVGVVGAGKRGTKTKTVRRGNKQIHTGPLGPS